MRCEDAQKLFDAYLNGELAGSLATELAAHRVQCADCRRALALMEVSGQIISSDRDRAELHTDFTERLLACVEAPRESRSRRIWRMMYVAGPVAAAAVVVLALFGVFDNRATKVAGKMEQGIRKVDRVDASSPGSELPSKSTQAADGVDPKALQEWLDQARQNLESKRQSGESLQQHLDLTAQQFMELLDRADQDRRRQEGSPKPEPSPPETAPDQSSGGS